MKWFKKLVFVACIILCFVSLVACSGNSKKTSNKVEENQSEEYNSNKTNDTIDKNSEKTNSNKTNDTIDKNLEETDSNKTNGTEENQSEENNSNKANGTTDTVETNQPAEIDNNNSSDMADNHSEKFGDSMTIERHPVATDYTAMFGKLDKLPEMSDYGYDIRSTDLSESILSYEYNKLIQATFDSKTIWPDRMPFTYKPEEVMELYKNPGLNVRSLHEKGVTGKGVGIAIIDQPLLVDHIEYKDRLKYYSERDSINTQEASMHGAAVASIAVGKNVGVAPEADLYYIADDFSRIDEDNSLLADSINKILDLNNSLPNENKIRVISISWGHDGNSEQDNTKLNNAYKRAKDEGVFLINTSLFLREDADFFGLDKLPLSDPDDFNSYTENIFGEDKTYNISVPMNDRCIASPTGTEDYVVYHKGGKSWATPYVAGLYALACQVKPDITYQEFWELASQTSRTGEGTYKGTAYQAKYIVDPVALIDALQGK